MRCIVRPRSTGHARQALGAEGAGEESARVAQRFDVDHEGASQRRLGEDHRWTSMAGMGVTKRPPQLRHIGQLRHDLVLQIPGQDQQVVGLGRHSSRAPAIGMWVPGRSLPCLCGIAVGDHRRYRPASTPQKFSSVLPLAGGAVGRRRSRPRPGGGRGRRGQVAQASARGRRSGHRSRNSPSPAAASSARICRKPAALGRVWHDRHGRRRAAATRHGSDSSSTSKGRRPCARTPARSPAAKNRRSARDRWCRTPHAPSGSGDAGTRRSPRLRASAGRQSRRRNR